jgi:hypothetical protein
MSCSKCTREQLNFYSQVLSNVVPSEFFVRIGDGDVQLIGCSAHLKELLDVIRSGDAKTS